VEEIQRKADHSAYEKAYNHVVEEVAYTWFNRLIAIRFMEVNDYLPTGVRVLSSEQSDKIEPDLVTYALDVDLNYSSNDKEQIIQLKHENKLDELFRMLFVKQSNELNANLPELFEKTNDHSELLLNVSFTDKDGVISRLVNDIPEDDFNISKKGQVEIIGWLYQFYNTEPKDETFALLKNRIKITKERIPSVTQLFTPDWIVRYMVENSLGRLWVEGHPNEKLKSNWKYYLEEAEQEPEVEEELKKIRVEYAEINPEDIKIIDPAMGSGHILVYAFDVLMQIYTSTGWSERDAAQSILENNLYGLDIDDRAGQLAYFAVMMKARQYSRHILDKNIKPNVFAIQDSSFMTDDYIGFVAGNDHALKTDLNYLRAVFKDAKEFGSILDVQKLDFERLHSRIEEIRNTTAGDLFALMHQTATSDMLRSLVKQAEIMTHKYDVVVTNPPYMGSSGMGPKLSDYVKKNYPDSKSDLFAVFIEKGNRMVIRNGFNSMVTMQSWMFLSSFEKMRTDITSNRDICNLMHMENMVMKIAFGTAVTVFRNTYIQNYKGTYNHIKLQDVENEKPIVFPIKENRYVAQQSNFAKIPGSPIAYWASEKIINCFSKHKTINDYANPRQGLATGNNNQYLRIWSEVSIKDIKLDAANHDQFFLSGKKYVPYNKGGTFRKWYADIVYIIRFDKGSYDVLQTVGNHLPSKKFYFKESITWSKVTSGGLSMRYIPRGSVFDVAGCSIFADNNMSYILAFVNSKVMQYLMNILSQTLNYEVGNVKSIPFIFANTNTEKQIEKIIRETLKLSKTDLDSSETSWDFQKHPLVVGTSIQKAFNKWKAECDDRFYQLKANEEKLNRIFIDIYDLQDELTPEVEDKDVTVSKADLKRDIRSYISYAVGCMFGRYSLDTEGLAYAGGQWDESEYKIFIPDQNNILPITDEEYFSDDIVGLFTEFVKTVYGHDTLEDNLDFIAKGLGTRGNSSRDVIRNYFMRNFYKDHCQIYKQRPIYWFFDSGRQNGFKALIYMHRYDENTIGNLRIDYLHRMQRIYEEEIARMQDTIDNSDNAREVR
ncbi:MAG TPA: BREX-1 system adenine-specific DNA-methyltransferase PglX, partial [Thermoclostridium sp.]|nr:BREX-1 system adenine-specific DNA-methyltransferase PglX [Thermoclostridium sp.]